MPFIKFEVYRKREKHKAVFCSKFLEICFQVCLVTDYLYINNICKFLGFVFFTFLATIFYRTYR